MQMLLMVDTIWEILIVEVYYYDVLLLQWLSVYIKVILDIYLNQLLINKKKYIHPSFKRTHEYVHRPVSEFIVWKKTRKFVIYLLTRLFSLMCNISQY